MGDADIPEGYVYLGNLTAWERHCVNETGCPFYAGETLLDFLKEAYTHVTETR